MLKQHIRMLLRDATGLDPDAATMDQALRARMRARKIDDIDAYAANVRPGSAELAALIDEVVVPETWFFREPEAFMAACRVMRDKRAHGVRPVRILSIPCASGEEPYSLAIALLEHAIDPSDVLIHGVDVSGEALARARRAVYQRNAFRGTDPGFRKRYFSEQDGSHTLAPHVQRLVDFEQANLLDLPARKPLARYDIIFCRNLLIYFDETTQRNAIDCLRHLLNPDGVLFTGYAEAAAVCRHGFALAPYRRAFALMRQECATPLTPQSMFRRTPAPAVHAVSVSGSMQTNRSARPTASPSRKASAPQADPEPLLQRARELADRGQPQDAAAAFRRYLRLVPDSAEAHFMLGLLNEQMDDLQGAEVSLRRALYLNPEHYEALCHLALLRDQHGDGTRAEMLRQRAARVYRRRSESREER